MYQLDVELTRAINALAGKSGLLDLLFIWISAIGIPLLVVAVALQWWRRTDRAHVRHILVSSGLSFLLGMGINQLILLFVHRTRPYDAGVTRLLIERSADPSFPSDHATASAAIAAAFLLHRMPKVGLVFTASAVLLMFSRVYIGTHYVSDVFGGAMTGLLAALAVRAVYREGTRVDVSLTSIL